MHASSRKIAQEAYPEVREAVLSLHILHAKPDLSVCISLILQWNKSTSDVRTLDEMQMMCCHNSFARAYKLSIHDSNRTC